MADKEKQQRFKGNETAIEDCVISSFKVLPAGSCDL